MLMWLEYMLIHHFETSEFIRAQSSLGSRHRHRANETNKNQFNLSSKCIFFVLLLRWIFSNWPRTDESSLVLHHYDTPHCSPIHFLFIVYAVNHVHGSPHRKIDFKRFMINYVVRTTLTLPANGSVLLFFESCWHKCVQWRIHNLFGLINNSYKKKKQNHISCAYSSATTNGIAKYSMKSNRISSPSKFCEWSRPHIKSILIYLY